MSKIDGYKSYFFSFLLLIVGVGYGLGFIDGETFLKIAGVLTGLLGFSLRHAIKKIE